MDKKELLISFFEQQGFKLAPGRASKLIEPGGVWDIVQILRSILFQADVTGARPKDDLRFDPGVKP